MSLTKPKSCLVNHDHLPGFDCFTFRPRTQSNGLLGTDQLIPYADEAVG